MAGGNIGLYPNIKLIWPVSPLKNPLKWNLGVSKYSAV